MNRYLKTFIFFTLFIFVSIFNLNVQASNNTIFYNTVRLGNRIYLDLSDAGNHYLYHVGQIPAVKLNNDYFNFYGGSVNLPEYQDDDYIYFIIAEYVNGNWIEVSRVDQYEFNNGKISLFLDGDIVMGGATGGIYFTPSDNLFTAYFELPDKKPVLDGETAFVTNVDAPMSELEIRSHITAYDDVDGDVTHKIILEEDNYTPNKFNVGEWTIKYSVSDSSGNIAYLTVHVLVRDVTNPVITGKSEYTQSMSTLLDISTLIDNLSVTDNYDENLTITVDKDNYTSNYNKPGTHTVIFKATDTSGNTGKFTVKINVIDDIKPVINGPTKIVKPQTEILTISDILKDVEAHDNYDGDITDKIKVIEDNYTGFGNIVGSYTITLEVEDNSGNKTQKVITIEVLDNIPPVFFVDNFFITVDQSVKLSRQDIIDLLIRTGQLTVTSQTTVTTVLDEYTGNENVPGMYAMSLRATSTDGNEQEYSVVVSVLNSYEELEDPIELEPQITFIDAIKNFFKWIWSLILRIWIKLKNWFKSF